MTRASTRSGATGKTPRSAGLFDEVVSDTERHHASGTFRRVTSLPLLIGPKNAEAVTGFSWRWCRDAARRLAVPFVCHGRKRAIRADLFLAALESERDSAAGATEHEQLAPHDVSSRIRSMLGKTRRPADE